jgi:hypothetical protein
MTPDGAAHIRCRKQSSSMSKKVALPSSFDPLTKSKKNQQNNTFLLTQNILSLKQYKSYCTFGKIEHDMFFNLNSDIYRKKFKI